MTTLHEGAVDLPNGEGVFLAVHDDRSVSIAVGTSLRASRVRMAEADFRELISRCREALHFLAAHPKKGQ